MSKIRTIRALANTHVEMWKKTGHYNPLTREGFDIWNQQRFSDEDDPHAILAHEIQTMKAALANPEIKDALTREIVRNIMGKELMQALQFVAKKSKMSSEEFKQMLGSMFDFSVPPNARLTPDELECMALEEQFIRYAIEKGYCAPEKVSNVSLSLRADQLVEALLQGPSSGRLQ